jgi:hypothetical protein
MTEASNPGKGIENVALVTKSLVYQAAQAIEEPGDVTLGSFFDLCSLCEATVILDKMQVLRSVDELPTSGLVSRLYELALLAEFEPEVSAKDLLAVQTLQLTASELPPEMASIEILEGPDLRSKEDISHAGAITGIDYDGDTNVLLSQIYEAVTYPSLVPDSNSSPRERVLRSQAYLALAAIKGLDYYPDFDRAPFVAALIKRQYRSLPLELYKRVAASFDLTIEDRETAIAEWTLNIQIPIPPVVALVLHRSSEVQEIPERLIEVRAEFEGYRRHFRQFKAELLSADTVKDRRKLAARYTALLKQASGDNHEIASLAEVINFAQAAARVAIAPAAPASYSSALLTQPLDWVRRWWTRRPLAVLFRLDGKLPKISEYKDLAGRLWGERVSNELDHDFVMHAQKVRSLMRSS